MRIFVYYDVQDRLAFLFNFLERTLLPAGFCTLIFVTERALAHQVDDFLWDHREIAFLPHGLAEQYQGERILIGESFGALRQADGEKVLINFSEELPPLSDDIDRYVEIVDHQPGTKKLIRDRIVRLREKFPEITAEMHSMKKK